MAKIFAVLCFTLLVWNVLATEHFQLFNEFIKTYNKNYESTAEWETRFEIFKQNLEIIEELNNQSTTAVYGITQFADMSQEEFAAYPCGGILSDLPEPEDLISSDPPEIPVVNDVPTEFDWTTKGAVTPVKNQGQCGSCWAFSTIGNIEGAWFLKGNPLVSLAEGELVDCSTTDYGCSGGWPYWALSDILKSPYNGRIDTEKSYPYVAKNMKCTFTTAGVGANYTSYTSYCKEGTTPCKEADIQNLLMTKGPLSVCLNAVSAQHYRSGVDSPSITACNPAAIDHCVTLVGWGVDATTNTPYWKLKNSWDTTWGEQGYYRLVRGVSDARGACGINTVVTAVTI